MLFSGSKVVNVQVWNSVVKYSPLGSAAVFYSVPEVRFYRSFTYKAYTAGCLIYRISETISWLRIYFSKPAVVISDKWLSSSFSTVPSACSPWCSVGSEPISGFQAPSTLSCCSECSFLLLECPSLRLSSHFFIFISKEIFLPSPRQEIFLFPGLP